MEQKRRKYYNEMSSTLSSDILRLKRRNKIYLFSELFTFISAIACVALYTIYNNVIMLLLSALFLLIYMAVRYFDEKNTNTIDKRKSMLKVYTNELSYLDGDYSCFDNGRRYLNPEHPYSYDMDIFGEGSLYNRICRTVTSGGSDCLAEMLDNCVNTNSDIVERRRLSIDELSSDEEWRAHFMSLGQNKHIDTTEIKNVLEEIKSTKIPSVASNNIVNIMAWVMLIAFYVVVLLSLFSKIESNIAVMWAVAQLFIVLFVCLKSLHVISNVVGSLHNQLQTYIALIRHVASANFLQDDNKKCVTKLKGDDTSAVESFDELQQILNGLDRRGNVLGMIFFNIFFLSDFFLIRRFLRWQRKYLNQIDTWVNVISDIDARVSMATFRYNETEAIDADVSDEDSVEYVATGITHPFLGHKAVANDFEIKDGHYYIITGANMAGKSTFLRSLGVNYILAMCGMPVFATKMHVTVFNLFSSMRTNDNLTQGISYFNAELLRLKQLIYSCKHADKTLIILDEILKGTNSLDKLNGSKMFLNAISSLPVSGVIATHDLELSKMEDSESGRFHNWCFEIKLSDSITYTYKISPGVAKNQNASYLLKRIISEI